MEVAEAVEVAEAAVVAVAVADLAFNGHRTRFSRTLDGGLNFTHS